MSKIDGRKAEIISVGRRYTTYTGFAERHGYPNAALKTWGGDKRQTPKNGDIVTLLTSGQHDSEGEGTLWIVEMANGDRFIFNEKGLRILDEKGEVTVIADEKLGGVEREYSEVKRKARVGERIMFNRKESGYTPGKIYETYAYPSGELAGDAVFKDDEDHIRWPEHNNFGYVVLEPTDIVRIDGVRYRMVERKARVGERVLATSGKVYEISAQCVADPNKLNVEFVNTHRKYPVLEPVKAPVTAASVPVPPQSDLQRTVDGLVEAVANLTRRVTELERPAANVSVKVASGPVNTALPTFAVRKPELTRDEIVDRAKRDVAELVGGMDGKYAWLAGVGHVTVEFVVNREKRTVAALLRRAYIAREEVRARGTAKCSPDDVFNVHIGKAVALRRALGLDVPAEYVTAPQPTEVRAGDIVMSPVGKFTVSFSAEFVTGQLRKGESYIIDDSREEVAALPDPERTDTVVASRNGHGGYIVKGRKYWVAEVREGEFRLITPGTGNKGGVWCGRDEFTFGTEGAAA